MAIIFNIPAWCDSWGESGALVRALVRGLQPQWDYKDMEYNPNGGGAATKIY